MKHIEFTVQTSERRMRLEDFLCSRLERISKMYIRELIRDTFCEVNGRYENIGYRLRPDDFVELRFDPDRCRSTIAEDLPLDIVYEDSDVLVVNKSAGMLVHPSHREKTGTLLNAVRWHCKNAAPDGETGLPRPGLIHRLDRATSGLIIVAKNARAHRIVAAQFAKRLVEKRYIALVEGIVTDDLGTIIGEIGRFADEKRWGLKPDGKPSETRFRVVERRTDTTLLELEPVTGRTNQLRIHCASLGHPIVGDVSRGGREHTRLFLHSCKLVFRRPSDGERVELEARPAF